VTLAFAYVILATIIFECKFVFEPQGDDFEQFSLLTSFLSTFYDKFFFPPFPIFIVCFFSYKLLPVPISLKLDRATRAKILAI